MTEVNCIICNKKFYPRYKKSKTCSKFCWEKNYKTTDKYKERKKAWNQSEKGKLWSNSYSKEYRKNNPDMMREIRIKYENTEKGKIKNKKYSQSEKGKKSKKKWTQSEKGIDYRRNVAAKSPKKKLSDKKYSTSEKGKEARRIRERKPENVIKKVHYRKTTITGQKLLMWSNMRSRLKRWTTNLGSRDRMEEIVGCTKEQLRSHIEKQFKPGMTWENYERYGWHLDHIIPLSNFDPNNFDDIKKANHYTNLQPLWAEENLKKSDKY